MQSIEIERKFFQWFKAEWKITPIWMAHTTHDIFEFTAV